MKKHQLFLFVFFILIINLSYSQKINFVEKHTGNDSSIRFVKLASHLSPNQANQQSVLKSLFNQS